MFGRFSFLAALVTVCLCVPFLAQEGWAQSQGNMVTDRPSQAISPFTVATGRFQVESNLLTHIHDNNIEADHFFVADTLVRVGVLEKAELGIIVRPFVMRDEAYGDEDLGIGDTDLRFKYNLQGNGQGMYGNTGEFALAVMPFITLPTGSAGFGYDEVTGGAAVPIYYRISPSITLAETPAMDYLPEDGEDDEFRVSNALAVFFVLPHDIQVFGEFYALAETDDWSDWLGTINVGLKDDLTQNLQLYAATYIGITDDAPDITTIFGLAARF